MQTENENLRKLREEIVDDHQSTSGSTIKCPKIHGKQKVVQKVPFKYNCYVNTNTDVITYGLKFCDLLSDKEHVFVAVGGNRISIYECPEEDGLQLMQVYEDNDKTEDFHCCTWTYKVESKSVLLVVGGERGIIRIIEPAKNACINHLIGHGACVNELNIMPKKPEILLSCSKDYSIRLWNIATNALIAIFGGAEGHRDNVLTFDINTLGNLIISSGTDHSLKIWRLDKPEIENAINDSFKYNIKKSEVNFPTIKEHFPCFNTRDVHGSYIDCVAWCNELIFSKSTNNCIICWKPNVIGQIGAKPKSAFTLVHVFPFKDCDIWFMKFTLKFHLQLLAVGNNKGKIYVWELNKESPKLTKCTILSYRCCVAPVRAITISKDGNILIAVCDNGTIWRWNRV